MVDDERLGEVSGCRPEENGVRSQRGNSETSEAVEAPEEVARSELAEKGHR